MYHPELIRHPESCPALVLNADYTPLSYYPLSLWPWQTAVKAVFLERVDIVAQYAREVHSPTKTMQLPSVIALRQYVKPSEHPAFTRFNPFLRDRYELITRHVRPGQGGLRKGRAQPPGSEVAQPAFRATNLEPREPAAGEIEGAHDQESHPSRDGVRARDVEQPEDGVHHGREGHG